MRALSRIVALNIEALRTARGWSKADLEERCAAHGAPIPRLGLTRACRGERSITVDELVGIGSLFGVEPWTLTADPVCGTCRDAPPLGFACNTCGTGAPS